MGLASIHLEGELFVVPDSMKEYYVLLDRLVAHEKWWLGLQEQEHKKDENGVRCHPDLTLEEEMEMAYEGMTETLKAFAFQAISKYADFDCGVDNTLFKLGQILIGPGTHIGYD